jgi:signal transduction histidine kinase
MPLQTPTLPFTATLAPGDPNRVISDAVQIVRPMIERKRIGVEMNLSPSLAPTPLDEGYLEQALVSLLTNACDAAPPGKTISITSRVIREAESPVAIIHGAFLVPVTPQAIQAVPASPDLKTSRHRIC